MTKATQTATLLVLLLSVYVALYTGVIPTSAKVQAEIVPLLPLWGLVAFGAFSLGTLGWDVLTFNDKPEKYKELLEVSNEMRRSLKVY